ncbi:hypothetical protein SAMN04487851_11365 [Prevotella sp. tc2-28]|uniref:hypothetical protein n=1 Tax=Prevotella sp. tc2-28 TaxID=1761888 RepID=UPI00089CA423|nr:hypothetical protein [Prevotella sp. tc2-28]SEA76229.1 hypothetical protein SAMN04487851_11365 [Prevotella sp. tc2-28]
MKSRNLILAAMLLAMPSTIMAQQNIKKAFDALLNEKITENRENHVLDRDPETGRMTAMADVYDFTISSKSALERLDDVRKAFEIDKKDAYSVNSGIREKGGEDGELESFASLFENIGFPSVSLFVGDGKHSSVSIGTMKGSDYIYACFADKDDPEHRYRYAYALEWVEKAKKTKVRLAVTYALRPEARDSSYGKKKSKVSRIIVNGKEYKKRNSDDNADDDRIILDGVKINGMEVARDGIRELIEDGINNGININVDSLLAYREKTPESWLSEFNTFKNLFMKNPTGTATNYYVSHIYKLCKNAGCLDDAEKAIVLKELEKMKKASNDDFLKQMFEMSSERLNK